MMLETSSDQLTTLGTQEGKRTTSSRNKLGGAQNKQASSRNGQGTQYCEGRRLLHQMVRYGRAFPV